MRLVNKLIAKVVKPVVGRRVAESVPIRHPADRRLVKAARPPMWRRGTLVLVA